MLKMTYDEYDETEDRLLDLDYAADGWWPTKEDLKNKLKLNNKSDVEFLMWILATNPEPDYPDEKESRKLIKDILYKNLELVEDPV